MSVSAAAAIDAPYCLVVDDEARLRQILMHLMRTAGFRCLEAENGAEALEQLARHRVTLVLSDLRMPRMDGLELLRAVRQRYPDTAMVMITAVADVEVAVNCLAQGAMDYLIKPFHLEEVRARVAQALERRRLILENRDYQERLEEKVAAQASRLEELFLAGVQALAEALELKDPYTRGHSVRVSEYSSIIARTLRLEDHIVRQIELGGHVHDIGKIGVREAVLNKPGRLTAEEYEHIMIHPLVGWRVLAPLLGDVPVALNIVRSHHERIDGRGGDARFERNLGGTQPVGDAAPVVSLVVRAHDVQRVRRVAHTIASTTARSNCVPALRCSSSTAASSVSSLPRYGRPLVIASIASAAAAMRASSGMASPASPSGTPRPSIRS